MKSTISFLLLAGNELSVQASSKYELLSDIQRTWPEAQAACQQKFGTDLASIHKQGDVNEAIELCRESGESFSRCWIGFHRNKGDELSWEWSDGSASDFATDFSGGRYPWGDTEPNNGHNMEECAELRSTYFGDVSCNRPLYAVCNAVGTEYDALTLGTNAKGTFGKTIDIGEEAFNRHFAKSKIIKRECPTCADSHKLIFYRRISDIGTFNAYANMKSWFGLNNNMWKQDFALYSSMDDLINDENRWTFCNYDDAGIGFPRDCGPTGHVAFQWTSATRGGKAAKFSIISGTCGGGNRGNGICYRGCCSKWGVCGNSVAHCGVSEYPDCKPDCLIDGKYQYRGKYYELDDKCYLAVNNCMGCLLLGADNYPDALKPASCSRYRRRLIEE